jgi:hypothetical protein
MVMMVNKEVADENHHRLYGFWVSATKGLDRILKKNPIKSFWAISLLFALLLFSHNPRKLLAPEFWGEDGAIWYTGAYTKGFFALASPEGGYLNSLQRLIAELSLPLPLHLVPFFFALMALLIQVLPFAFFAGARFSGVWPDALSRFLFSAFLVVMPNAPETSVNVTDSQWYLAVFAFLLLIAPTSPRKTIHWVECVILLISGLSGPFCIVLLPIAALQFFLMRSGGEKIRGAKFLIILITSLIQVFLIMGFSHAGRVSGPLGASVDLLPRIIAMIPLGGSLGYVGISRLINWGFFSEIWPSLCVLIFYATIMVLAFRYGPLAYRQFIFFVLVMFVLALCKPLMSLVEPQWPLFMRGAGAGNRYFLYPMIAWWLGLVVVVARGPRLVGYLAGGALLVTTVLAIPRDWGDRYHFPATDFALRARQFEAAQPGTQMVFMTHPPGTRMIIVKK